MNSEYYPDTMNLSRQMGAGCERSGVGSPTSLDCIFYDGCFFRECGCQPTRKIMLIARESIFECANISALEASSSLFSGNEVMRTSRRESPRSLSGLSAVA